MKKPMAFYRRSGVQEQLFLNTHLLVSCSPVLKRVREVGCVLLCVGVLTPAPAVAQAKAAAVPRARALELFATNCSICHGPEGAGTPLTKDLAFKGRGKWKHGNRLADVVKTITNGVPATPMLPFQGRLTPAEINALASLVRSFDKTIKPAGSGGKR